jgi:hypothetical protein
MHSRASRIPSPWCGTGSDESFVDGYECVRALHRVGQDVVRAAEWMPSELEAALGPGDASAGPSRCQRWALALASLMQEKSRRNQR